MGVKRGNLKLISGVLLPSFILNYILIRVKERGFNKENRKNKRERENRTRKRETKLGKFLLNHSSSVEVGYGFYTIRSKLLIANDMYG